MIPLRSYTVPFTATVASAAAIDFFELTNTSGSGIALLGLIIGQSTETGDAGEEQIRYFIKRASGSYTSGTGGTAVTAANISKVRSGEKDATFSAEFGNTTQLVVGTGTLKQLHADTFNVRNGLQLFWTPETAFTAAVSEALVIGMAVAPADSITWEGTAYVAELLP